MGDAVTGLTGLYEVEVGAGSYTVSFEECVPGALVSEWWDDKGSQGAADGVVVSGGVVTSGIDAQLDFGVLCDGLKPTLWGTWGPDVLVGTPGPDVILGLGGKDLLSGLGGADILCGGNGDDVLAGGAGDDDLFGGAGIDTADYSSAPFGVVVDLALGVSAGGDGSDSISGVENVTGSDYDDELSGDSGPNVLRGRPGFDDLDGRGGDDSLNGGSQDDFLTGGPGDDALIGGNGIDVADYSGAAGSSNGEPRDGYRNRSVQGFAVGHPWSGRERFWGCDHR